VRIDFAGAWTDVPLFTTLTPGVVVNAAISLYAYTTVEPLASGSPTYGEAVQESLCPTGIRICSVDLGQYVEAASVSKIEYNGTMDLVKAACKSSPVRAAEVTTWTDSPAGSGLGTSASLGVAALSALWQYGNKLVTRHICAHEAFELETKELGLLSGTQDQYAAVLGGFNCFRCVGSNVTYNDNLNTVDALTYELEKRLVLVYTGKSRLSSDIHSHVTSNFKAQRNHPALRNLVKSGELAREALLTRNISKLTDAINMSWANQKLLHESITNDQIESLFEIAAKNGMVAGKACGAGGGGCLLFLAERGKEHMLRKALEEHVKVLNFKFDFDGLHTWELFE